MSTHVSALAFWQDGKLVLADGALFVSQLKRAKFGAGEALVVRVEREADAYTYGALKHYWGHIVGPFCDWTGYHKHEAHLMLKAECMPEGKVSLTQLNREEMTAFSEAAEQTAREWCPDAFALYDRVSA